MNSQQQIYFQVYEVPVVISFTTESAEITEIKNCFNVFKSTQPIEYPKIHLIQASNLNPDFNSIWFQFKKKYFSGILSPRRQVLYMNDKTAPIGYVIQSVANNIQVKFFGKDPKIMYEILYNLMTGLVGWELEKLGWTRLHAMAYETKDGKIQAFWGPSGAGKSTLSLKAISLGRKILGDETVLINRDLKIRAFPIPIQISPTLKSLVPENLQNLTKAFPKLHYSTKLQVSIPETLIYNKTIFVDKIFFKTSWTYLLFSLVFGIGLPQFLEQQLRRNNILNIFRVLSNRTYILLKLILTGRFKQKTFDLDAS